MDPAARSAESPDDSGSDQDPGLARPVPRSHPLLAWLVIVLVVAVVLIVHARAPRPSSTDDVPVMNAMMRQQGQRLLAGREWAWAAIDGPVAIEELDRGGVPQRLRVVVLVGEFVGTDAALARLVETADAYPDGALFGPTVIDTDGTVELSHDVGLFDRRDHGHRDNEPSPDGPCCAEFLSGAVTLLRMTAYREVGPFDPRLFL